MRIPFLNLQDTNRGIEGELAEACARVIGSGRYLHGAETEALERELAAACGTDHCVGTSNGLDAIRLILRGWMELGMLKEGDEVIVPANTYIASILPITELGLRPEPVEPDEETFCLNFEEAEKHISGRTRAIMPVHLYGNVAWNEKATELARKHDLLVIEDNAQAIGAESATAGLWGSKITGGLGHAAALSFYPTKNIGAAGDAGAVTTNDKRLADTVRALANYGSDRRYHNIYRGWNCRIDEIQAAMLRVKLKRLDSITAERRRRASLYDKLIRNEAVSKPVIREGQVWHQYVVRSRERDRLKKYLEDNGIGCDIHYAVAPHRQPCYEGTLGKETYELTERLSAEVLSLPIANVTDEEVRIVAETINNFR